MPYYDDEGNEIDVKNIPIPQLCLSCEKKDDPGEEILCNLNRLDQRNEKDFQCGVYVSIYGALAEEIIE